MADRVDWSATAGGPSLRTAASLIEQVPALHGGGERVNCWTLQTWVKVVAALASDPQPGVDSFAAASPPNRGILFVAWQSNRNGARP